MANILGTIGDDSLAGVNAESNLIDGLEGNDTIQGGKLSDTLNGDEGNDRIFSNFYNGYGSFESRGKYRGVGEVNSGSDFMDGGTGNDLLVSIGAFNPILKGGVGDDTLEVRPGIGFSIESGGAEIDGGDGFDILGIYEIPSGVSLDANIVDLNNVDFNILSLPKYIKSVKNVEGIKDFYGGEGNDTVTVSGNSTIGRIINGGNGDNNLSGGYGDDTIVFGTGNNTANGGAGNDVLGNNNIVNYEKSIIDGGEGFDYLATYDSGAPANLDLNNIDFTVLPLNIKSIQNMEGIRDFYGSPENDIVTASGDNTMDHVIAGRGGNDNITGGSGNDVINGDSGNDIINGGSGDDIIDSQPPAGVGDDTIYGGDGNDQISGGAGLPDRIGNISPGGSNTIYGEAGNDRINCLYCVSNTIDGGDGDDSINGGTKDTINGGAGNDTIIGTGSDDVIDGGDDDDIIDGGGDGGRSGLDIIDGGGMDIINGGNGNDLIRALSRNSTISGGNGDDTISGFVNNFGNRFNSTMYGGDGNDIIDGGTPREDASPGAFSSIDVIYGGDGNDTILGRGGDDTIYGDGGDDFTYGGFGNEIISGGSGIDNLEGNGGNDIIYGDDGDDGLAGQDGNDSLVGGNGNDRLYGWNDNDILFGDDGNDTIYGDSGDDFAYGGSGDDLMFGGNGTDNFEGNEGDDTIFGDDGNDGLAGQDGDDSLVGGNGSDRLYGWTGNDTLLGDAGNDSLYGGNGDDLLTGGAGADTFNFGSDFLIGDPFSSLGLDTITDFQSGVDTIQLVRSAFSTLTGGISFATVENDDLAAVSSEVIVYSQATGTLFYNTNGVDIGLGEGGAFTKLGGNPVLAATDFTISG